MPFTMTPAGANELIFAETIWDYNTGSGMLPQGSFFDTNTFDGESQSGPEPVDESNAWGHMLTTSTAPSASLGKSCSAAFRSKIGRAWP